jgi:hypothetical protein
MLLTPVVPSLCQLQYSLLKYISSHPLMQAPLVFHPVTKLHIPVNSYRFQRGIPLTDGLSCAIIPAYYQSDPSSGFPSPASINTSVLYKPYELGRHNEEALYQFYIEFTYREVSIESMDLLEDPYFTEVFEDAPMHPNEIMLKGLETKNIEVSINPPLEIISNYLELVRLIMYDKVHMQQQPLNPLFPGQIEGIECVHLNYSTSNWSENTNPVFHQGHLCLRLQVHINMGWRDKFTPILNQINTEYQRKINITVEQQKITFD